MENMKRPQSNSKDGNNILWDEKDMLDGITAD